MYNNYGYNKIMSVSINSNPEKKDGDVAKYAYSRYIPLPRKQIAD